MEQLRIELFIFSTLSLWSLASMIYIRQCFFLRRNLLLAGVQLTGVYALNKHCTQLLLNKQDTFKIGLQRILYVVLDSSRHRPKAKSFRLLQHSIIDNILNFSTSFFSMQTNGFFFELLRLQVFQTSAATHGRLLTDQKELLCLSNGAINLSAFLLRKIGSYLQWVQNRRPAHTACCC